MIIGIDGNEANQSQKVGIGQYAWHLLHELYRNDLKNSYIVFLKELPKADMPQQREGWQYKVLGPGFLWTQWRLPLELFLSKPRPDVFFSPTHYAPRFSPVPTVVSVMDVSYLRFPNYFRRQDLWQLKLWTKYSVQKAARVLTISQSTKHDLQEAYGLSQEKIVVTYPGYDKSIHKVIVDQAKIAAVKAKYGIKGDYILSVGTLQPRKNYERLIEAFAKIKRQTAGMNGSSSISLVIAGKKGWLYEPIMEKVKTLGMSESVRFVDFIPAHDLALLYNGAKLFALVSLFEGFGIPVLEAMACGCPVLLSNVSSLPEVGGKAAIYIDPQSVGSIAKGLEQVLADKTLQEKAREQGLTQACQFSWEKCGRETLRVLEGFRGPLSTT